MCFTMKLIDNWSTILISQSRLKAHSSDPLLKPHYQTPMYIMAKQKGGKTAPVTSPASSEIDLDSSLSD